MQIRMAWSMTWAFRLFYSRRWITSSFLASDAFAHASQATRGVQLRVGYSYVWGTGQREVRGFEKRKTERGGGRERVWGGPCAGLTEEVFLVAHGDFPGLRR